MEKERREGRRLHINWKDEVPAEVRAQALDHVYYEGDTEVRCTAAQYYAHLEEEAMQKGLTVEQLKTMKRLERENAEFKRAEQERARIERERKAQDMYGEKQNEHDKQSSKIRYSIKEKLEGAIGGAGTILFYIISILMSVSPLVLIDLPFWIDVLLLALLSAPFIGDIAYIFICIKAFPVAISDPADFISILFFISFAINISCKVLPLIIALVSAAAEKIRGSKIGSIAKKIGLSLICLLIPSFISTLCRTNGIILGGIPVFILYTPFLAWLGRIWRKRPPEEENDKTESETDDVSKTVRTVEDVKADKIFIERKDGIPDAAKIDDIQIVGTVPHERFRDSTEYEERLKKRIRKAQAENRKLRKWIVALSLFSAFLLIAGASVYVSKTNTAKETEAEIDRLKSRLQEEQENSANAWSRVLELGNERNALMDEIAHGNSAASFFERHAYIISTQDELCHSYGCPALETADGIWILNKEAALGEHLEICPQCNPGM